MLFSAVCRQPVARLGHKSTPFSGCPAATIAAHLGRKRVAQSRLQIDSRRRERVIALACVIPLRCRRPFSPAGERAHGVGAGAPAGLEHGLYRPKVYRVEGATGTREPK